MAIQPYQEDNEASAGPLDTAPVKRLRWATQRVTGSQGGTKRQSILRRLSHKKRSSDDSTKRESNGTDLESVPEGPEAAAEQAGAGRRVFFNMPLPEDARDEEGHPTTQFCETRSAPQNIHPSVSSQRTCGSNSTTSPTSTSCSSSFSRFSPSSAPLILA